MDNTTTNVQGRELKFRAFNKYGMSAPFTLKEVSEFGTTQGEVRWPDPTIFLQFTGLRDKSGKEIYEGDIVTTGTDKNMVIGWSERFASFVIKRDGWMFQHWFGEAMEASDCEVIGNIYENGHLLKPEGKVVSEGLIDNQ